MAGAQGKRKRRAGPEAIAAAEANKRSQHPGGSASGLPELLRRVITTGLSGLFTTNEVVRRAVGEAMPREWVDFAVDQSERTRAEFIERLAGELARTLESLELVEMAERLLDGRTIEIRAQIQLLPREGKVATRRLDVAMGRREGKR